MTQLTAKTKPWEPNKLKMDYTTYSKDGKTKPISCDLIQTQDKALGTKQTEDRTTQLTAKTGKLNP